MQARQSPAKSRSMVSKSLLGGLTPAKFLREYWQKKPLLVRGAWPDFQDLVTPDELAGMATEAGINSRLVSYQGGKKPWRLEHGPFAAKRLERLPRRNFSLLVQGVNQHLESAALLLDHFRFLPTWRLDDLMVSFAPEGGGVGPHVDSYDVFLIQGMGRRRWEIAEQFDPSLIAGIDLKILRNFQPEQSWVLEPGDMLYLPPGVAHNGVALEPCLTYSVGFRAPFARTLLGSLLNVPDAVLPPETDLYADPDLAESKHPAEVGDDAVQRLRQLVMPLIANNDLLGRWLAAAVSSVDLPYAWVPESGQPALDKVSEKARAQILRQMQQAPKLWRSDHCRFASRRGETRIFVYINGEEYALPLVAQDFVDQLLSQRVHSSKTLLDILPTHKLGRQAALSLLVVLKREAAIYFER